MPFQFITQDIQQIREICQQLAQNERLNAQFLAQAGMQTMVQRETFASHQLQLCVNLCNQIEQTMSQAIYGGYTDYNASTGFSNQSSGYNSVNNAVLNQMMQSGRQGYR